MTSDEIIAEAELLARECVLLVPGRGEPVAVWRGAEGQLVSVNRAICPDIPGPGVLSLWKKEKPVATLDDRSVAEIPGGTPLVSRVARSLPPVDAVFQFGSAAIGSWLHEVGWQRDWPFNDNFPQLGILKDYERVWQSECPLYRSEPYAVIGGWHFPYPDGDWLELVSDTLLLWTLRDAEPWYEVWFGNGQLRVIERVT